MSLVSAPEIDHNATNATTPINTNNNRRVVTASNASSAPLNSRFGTIMTPKPHRYGASENGPSRSGSIHGMTEPSIMPSAVMVMTINAMNEPAANRPHR